MAATTNSKSRIGLAFVLGILFVIVCIGGYALLAGDGDLGIAIEGEDTTIEKAAEALSDG